MQTPALVPLVQGFFDAPSFSIQYVVACPRTRCCAIVDPVLDFDERSGATGTTAADAILAAIAAQGLSVAWILDTHPHADHLSAAAYLKAKTGAPTAIGARVCEVQAIWRDIYDWPELACDGSQWDRLFAADETFRIGDLEALVMPTPGHTRASVTYVVGDAAFVADTLFMPDTGTARADFPGGSAAALYASIQNLFALPAATRVFTGHDYRQGGRKRPSKARSARNAPPTSISPKGRHANSLSPYGRRATAPCRCRASSCMRCR